MAVLHSLKHIGLQTRLYLFYFFLTKKIKTNTRATCEIYFRVVIYLRPKYRISFTVLIYLFTIDIKIHVFKVQLGDVYSPMLSSK